MSMPAPEAPRRRATAVLMKGIALVGLLVPGVAHAEVGEGAPRQRIKVVVPDPDEAAIREVVERTAAAVDEENLDGVLASIRPARHEKHRRRLGLLFVAHDVGLDLEDQQLLSRSGSRAEVAVKYSLTLSRATHDYVSVLVLHRTGNGAWLIDREEIASSATRASSYDSETGDGGVICIGGRCGVR